MACLECRRRRIKCDGARPKCHQCARLSKKCEYAVLEQRRGPKKRSVKELEDRLASVEAMLSGGSLSSSVERSSSASVSSDSVPDSLSNSRTLPTNDFMPYSDPMDMLDFVVPTGFQSHPVESMAWPDMSSADSAIPPIDHELQMMLPEEIDKFPDLIEIQDLNKIFFEAVYPCIPIVHPDRHNPKPPIETPDPLCLRYAMWAHAAARSTRYTERASGFYRNARMHLEHDEMQDDGLGLVSIAHVQACILIAIYEAGIGSPARAFMSSRRAIALSSIMGLHAQDAGESWATFKICKPAKDQIEAEERRRTFWYLYYADMWASSASGKSSGIRESEITTLLPTSEKAFRNGLPESGQTLQSAIENGLSESTCSLSVAVVSGWLLCRLTAHLRQLQEDLKEDRDDIQGFWLRHQQLDNDITKLIVSMPDNMRPSTTIDAFAFFVNMCLHEFLITLFQTASTFAHKHSVSAEIVARFRSRARRAAEEIIDIMRYAGILGVQRMFASTPSCLYLASSVFILDLKAGHNVEHSSERLRFILHSIRQFRERWKISQLFLEQLLRNLEDCDINLEITPADTVPIKCLEYGDWESLGPLFAADLALVKPKLSTG